jgi:hypothetical protein
MNKGGRTRLERFIARMLGQRCGIDAAAAATAALPGVVWELGLGNGRTYDHLRERFHGRAIVVFDRQIMAHPDCIPPADMVRLGDFRDTLPAEVAHSRRAVVVVHADIGNGDVAASRALGCMLAPLFVQALVSGGYLVGDQPMDDPALVPIALADIGGADLPADTYFVYRRR